MNEQAKPVTCQHDYHVGTCTICERDATIQELQDTLDHERECVLNMTTQLAESEKCRATYFKMASENGESALKAKAHAADLERRLGVAVESLEYIRSESAREGKFILQDYILKTLDKIRNHPCISGESGVGSSGTSTAQPKSSGTTDNPSTPASDATASSGLSIDPLVLLVASMEHLEAWDKKPGNTPAPVAAVLAVWKQYRARLLATISQQAKDIEALAKECHAARLRLDEQGMIGYTDADGPDAIAEYAAARARTDATSALDALGGGTSNVDRVSLGPATLAHEMILERLGEVGDQDCLLLANGVQASTLGNSQMAVEAIKSLMLDFTTALGGEKGKGHV